MAFPTSIHHLSLSSDDVAPPSIPQRDTAVFSNGPSSPPSSPPGFPWDQQTALDKSQPARSPAKSAFSLLGKRKALADIVDNVRPAKKAANASTKLESKRLAQMQINLGQEVQRKCKACGMEYIASSAEDRELHDKYHKQIVEGYDVGKDFVQRARKRTVFAGVNGEDSICAVDCLDKSARKRRAQAVLEIVQRELGAVPILEKELWDATSSGVLGLSELRCTTYLYIRGTKCLGFLLTEVITSARRVLGPAQGRRQSQPASTIPTGGALSTLRARKQAAEDAVREAANQPIELSDTSYRAKLGISRIWTSPHHRHHNIATALLDAAILHHNQRTANQGRVEAPDTPCASVTAISGGPLEPLRRLMSKEDVAFSAPTGAGAGLARRWFGMLYGWGVYVD
ncbi:hypothetical protein LTR91_019326 [Friedmanniomyces endolithicus]|uniref:N-acetyltransferase ECO1 n=1 Tax=Friedmanniomyces endolithicus TaxID=329885 RepID=A0AAN6FZA1_9PEZI|nr:hypothetical protein LTR35_013556 [Friedmanniomyces endolithicus]KAK0277332.1 hypothetical protein LTS00_014166 [Friedmanniomyces endolithicus]KAK0325669.1 hypothetical protein LTR82_003205 [Friedmanniomyces endolithicus]KAK0926801.1 hypothetical protein LTR57_003843 [Friedmanniomyces endolithicus]KAK0962716.1 hypothetical protein LTR91_019326 [Friedmanniomyces endolithicus]